MLTILYYKQMISNNDEFINLEIINGIKFNKIILNIKKNIKICELIKLSNFFGDYKCQFMIHNKIKLDPEKTVDFYNMKNNDKIYHSILLRP